MKKNQFKMLMVILLFVLAATGCASVSFVRTDPFQTDINEGVVVRVISDGNVSFDNKNGDCLKINEVIIPSNEFILPMAPSYEMKFRVAMSNRSLVGALSKITGKATITYDGFERNKTYLLCIEETGGSKVGAFFLGAMLPAFFNVVLYQYHLTVDNRIKLEEFDVDKIDGNDF